MAELTITRADLVEVATEALSDAPGVTDEQKLEMCETAHKTESILLGKWLTRDCGCLVGATYREILRPGGRGAFNIVETLGQPMSTLGMRFDKLLREKIDGPECAEVKVID